MAVKSQASIDAGAGLALAGSRTQGTELATSAGGKNIAGTDIAEEFGNGGSTSNINLDDYHTGSGGLVPAGTAGVAGAAGATKRFQNYVGVGAIGIDSSWTMPNWDGIEYAFGGLNTFTQAFMQIFFYHESANNRIRVDYSSGTSAALATTYTSYVNYIGLSGATWSARYNVVSQAVYGDAASGSCHGAYSAGPTPVYDGENSGTFYTFTTGRQFFWMAQANPNQNCQGSAQVLGSFDYTSRVGGSGLASFELKAVLGGTTYTSKSDINTPALIQNQFALSASTSGLPILPV